MAAITFTSAAGGAGDPVLGLAIVWGIGFVVWIYGIVRGANAAARWNRQRGL